jgi:hypothetical protein
MARSVQGDFRNGIQQTRPGYALYRDGNAAYVPPTKDFYAEKFNMGERKWLDERWRQLPGVNASVGIAKNTDFEVLGVNAVDGSVTFDAEGGIKLTTAGADLDSVIILPHLDAGQSAWTGTTWGTDREVVFSEVIKTGASIAATVIWWGLKLTNTPTVGTDADEIFVRYEAGVSSGKFVVHWAIGGTDSSTVTTVTVAADTVYDLSIEIDENRRGRVYINGSLVATTGILTNAIDLIPYLGVKASGAAAAKSVTSRDRAISRVAA